MSKKRKKKNTNPPVKGTMKKLCEILLHNFTLDFTIRKINGVEHEEAGRIAENNLSHTRDLVKALLTRDRAVTFGVIFAHEARVFNENIEKRRKENEKQLPSKEKVTPGSTKKESGKATGNKTTGNKAGSKKEPTKEKAGSTGKTSTGTVRNTVRRNAKTVSRRKTNDASTKNTKTSSDKSSTGKMEK